MLCYPSSHPARHPSTASVRDFKRRKRQKRWSRTAVDSDFAFVSFVSYVPFVSYALKKAITTNLRITPTAREIC